MQFLEAVRIAFAQIRAQKLKSFFTLVGVTIGVMFLIAVVAVVNGMGRYVEEDFAAKFLGVNTFNVRRFPDIQTGNVTEATWREWQRRPAITEQDAYAVRAALPNEARWAIDQVDWLNVKSPYVNGGPQIIAHAATPDLFIIKDLMVETGRAFSEQENIVGAPVVVIGQQVAEHFFPSLDPVGRELRIAGLPYRVIGVLERQGSVFGLSLDLQIVAPYGSPLGRSLYNPRRGLYGVVVQAPSEATLAEARETVREVLRRRRKLHPTQPDNFALETSESALSQWQTIKKFLVLAGIVLPAIGLVVGAIVIMNIMLVAVAQRTHEIGIRKSLGARRGDIMTQFLIESATLSVIGSIFGIALGFGLAAAIRAASPLPASVALWSIVVSVAVGAGVGILAGIYPARRASRLDPVVALRAE
jgi:putative ABC transport system permease protein